VGETEKNVRDLFADAEQDQRNLGDEYTFIARSFKFKFRIIHLYFSLFSRG